MAFFYYIYNVNITYNNDIALNTNLMYHANIA